MKRTLDWRRLPVVLASSTALAQQITGEDRRD
jgi:hypothetical protein